MEKNKFSTVTTFTNEDGEFVMLSITDEGNVMFKREYYTVANSLPMKDVHEVFDINFSFPEGLIIKPKKSGKLTRMEEMLIESHLRLLSDFKYRIR